MTTRTRIRPRWKDIGTAALTVAAAVALTLTLLEGLIC